jgi:hypothetical protein
MNTATEDTATKTSPMAIWTAYTRMNRPAFTGSGVPAIISLFQSGPIHRQRLQEILVRLEHFRQTKRQLSYVPHSLSNYPTRDIQMSLLRLNRLAILVRL